MSDFRFSDVQIDFVRQETGRERDKQVRDRAVRGTSVSQQLRNHTAQPPITYQRTHSSTAAYWE